MGELMINSKKFSIGFILSIIILTIIPNTLTTAENDPFMETENIKPVLLQESGIISGILEENNPVLGYVTLYFQDGYGTSTQLDGGLSNYRTYSYLNIDYVEIYKNGKPALIEDFNPGDSIFLKLDEAGNIILISGSDNFYPIFGKVRMKGSNSLQIEMENKTVRKISIPRNTPIFHNKRRVTWDDIREGDEIRIFMQTCGNQITIGEVTLGRQSPVISNVYKAQLNYYDADDNKLVISGLQYFKDGLWRTSRIKGITQVKIDNGCKPDIQDGAHGIIYFATTVNKLGHETIIRLVAEDKAANTRIISDTIAEAMPGQWSVSLLNGNNRILYGDNTLIVKGGKLLEPNQVKKMDEAYLVVSSLTDGSQKADIIWLKEQAADTGLTILRGRISGIEFMESITLESFSQFTTPDWEFINVQKTITIDPMVTRIFDDGGRIDPSEFNDTGEAGFKNRTVYVLAQEGKAMMISTAPFGDVVIIGRIKELDGLEKDSFGHIITEPESIVVSEAKMFNRETWLWDNHKETGFTIPQNAVFIKNGKVIERGSLEEGDRVTIIRSVAGNNAYVIMAESW